MRQRLVFLAYVAGWRVVRVLPEGAAYRLFDVIADAIWRRGGRSVRQLERNLQRVVPGSGPDELRRRSRWAMRSYLRYWCEAFRLPEWDDERIQRVRIENFSLVQDARAAGRGVVCVLPHSGNWDHAGAWLVKEGIPFTTVAERLKPEELFDAFLSYRERLGMEVLPLTGGRETFLSLADRLRQGGLVALLGDRDLTRNGVEVEVFGEPTKMPAGPASLALSTGALLLSVHVAYDGPRLHIRFGPAIEPPSDGSRPERVAAMTQQVAVAFEAAIRETPEDWHMLQPLWLADLSGDRTTSGSRA
jgi:KDO2-lipid IV(A) lauroyltransferase